MINVVSVPTIHREQFIAMMSRAFQLDLTFSFIFPDARNRARGLPRLFRLAFDSDGEVGMRLMTEDGAAGTLWRRPGHAQTGLGELLRQTMPILVALGSGTVRGLRVLHAIESHLPKHPFWYLHYVGCEPTRQRTGLGAAVVRAGLSRTGEIPVYLETANQENIPFYEQLGFEVTEKWRAFQGGPMFWSMLRQST